jgi:hypothetical protein
VLFHFEYLNDDRWETIGSGEGGEEQGALLELSRLAGGALPQGIYRCIAARSESTHWETLRLTKDGKVDHVDAGDFRSARLTA